MKNLITILLLVAVSFDTLAACNALQERVDTDVNYLWMLKGNTEKVSNEQYQEAYNSYELNLKALELCKAANA
ncbi:hypothetical protein VPHK460_0152 [Vibrio phage K460]